MARVSLARRTPALSLPARCCACLALTPPPDSPEQVYQGGETTDGRRIYVGNINYDFAENEIRNAFNDVRMRRVALGCARVCVPWAARGAEEYGKLPEHLHRSSHDPR
jgi:hypothetical protein